MLAEAAELLRGARRPLIVSGGGTIYAEATDALRELAEATGIAGRRDAGRQGLAALRPPAVARRDRRHRHHRRQRDRPRGRRDPRRRHALERLHHRLALAVRRRTRASSTSTSRAVDAFKHAGLPLVGRRARRASRRSHDALEGWSADPDHTERATKLAAEWDATVERAYTLGHGPLPAQSEVLGVVNRVSGPRDVVVCAAGSMPGDLHKLWRTRDPKGYHVEYGYSCMGYEIAGGLGVKLAAPDREVYVMVGDGSFLMMAQEIVTAVAGGRRSSRSSSSRTTASPRSARCRSRSARSASARATATATARTCRSTSPPSPQGSAPTVVRATTLDELEAGAAGAGRGRRHRRADPDRPARARARAPRRGGTCRSPRSPASTPRAPRARRTRRTSRPSSST